MHIHVVCFGNLLAGDDGLGPHIYQVLAQNPPAKGDAVVHVFDGGLMGFSALTFFEDCDAVIVVDAIAKDTEEGTIRSLSLEDVAGPKQAFSAHALDLTHLFHVLPIVFEGRSAPQVRIVGVEISPPRCDFHIGLSAPIAAAVPAVLQRIDDEIRAFASLGESLNKYEGAALR